LEDHEIYNIQKNNNIKGDRIIIGFELPPYSVYLYPYMKKCLNIFFQSITFFPYESRSLHVSNCCRINEYPHLSGKQQHK